jgi:2-phosphosulfolactate phosphatase
LINISVYLTQSLVTDELVLKDKNVVVVDVLRASSTILTALVNGAKEIIPAESSSVAARISKGSGNSLLCGERNGKVIEGFNLGNSPFEYSEEAVKGKTLIFSTTNGTVSITKSKYAKNCIIAGFLNMKAVVDYLSELNEDFTIVCSGKLNDFCVEDMAAAGMIISELFDKNGKNNYKLLDSGYVCYKMAKNILYKPGKSEISKIQSIFKKSEHGQYLNSLGFENDLEYCAQLNKFKEIPVFRKGMIKLKDTIENEQTQKSKMKRINISNKPNSGG